MGWSSIKLKTISVNQKNVNLCLYVFLSFKVHVFQYSFHLMRRVLSVHRNHGPPQHPVSCRSKKCLTLYPPSLFPFCHPFTLSFLPSKCPISVKYWKRCLIDYNCISNFNFLLKFVVTDMFNPWYSHHPTVEPPDHSFEYFSSIRKLSNVNWRIVMTAVQNFV